MYVCSSTLSFSVLMKHSQLPEEVFNARMERLQLLIRKEFPNIHPDSYMFSVAILLVIITAVFSIIARGLEISMWYPLLILLAPGLLAYWTTRRRSMHYLKMSQVSVQNLVPAYTCVLSKIRFNQSFKILCIHA